MINIAICDADEKDGDSLAAMTNEIFQNHVHIHQSSNFFMLKTVLCDELKGRINILIMNIKLGDIQGIYLADQIQTSYPGILIAFISDTPEVARYIFRANPSYFLVKPVHIDELSEAMDCMMKQLKKQTRNTFIFETKRGVCPILVDSIKYIESDRRFVKFWLNDNRVESGYGKLDVIQEKLPRQFVRCHQSYIANMNKILYFTPTSIVFEDETAIPISRPKYKSVREIMMDYLDCDYEQAKQMGVYQ